ncbi:MAG TPA: extensin family protein [Beijerinckiaceae bacterium]
MLRLLSGAFALTLLVTPALGQAPLPPPRPEGLGTEAQAGAGEVPLPPERPPGLDEPAQLASPPPAQAAHPSEGENADACLARLDKLGVRAGSAPAVGNGACGAPHPLRLVGLPDGLEVSPPALVTCAVAEALAKWTLEAVSAEAERHLAEAPQKILIGTSYECRGQNRQAGAKLSEHAFANAVDVMGFAFRKRPAVAVTARSGESPEALFQAAVRARACAYFTTVLGPGSDAAHADHLHLDMRERRPGVRICQ